MDENISSSDIEGFVSTINLHCLKRYHLKEIPLNLEENLNNVLQEVTELERKYLEDLEDLVIIQELGKNPDDWITRSQAEQSLRQSEELLQEINEDLQKREDKYKTTIGIASDALQTLKDKLHILMRKKSELEAKSQSCQFSKAAEKSELLLCAAIKEKDILQSRLERLQELLLHFQEDVDSSLENEAGVKKHLQMLQSKLDLVAEFSGMSCQLLSDTVIQVEFQNSSCTSINTSLPDLEATLEEIKLLVTLEFSKQGQLTNVQLNQAIGVKDVISKALVDNNVLRLMMDINKLWSAQNTLISEISLLRKRHAIDWIPEKNVLLFIAKHKKNCVCSLKVPSTYPQSGEIILESIVGHPSGITAQDVKPPMQTSLIEWLNHLESFLKDA